MAESIIGSAKEREGNLTPLEEQYIRLLLDVVALKLCQTVSAC